jgi:hypothetical protein
VSVRGKRAVSIAALGTVNLPARQAEVYEFVRAHPYHTALELENMSGYRRIGCRLAELERAGLLRVLDPRPDHHTGRNAHVWVAECDPRLAEPRKPRETARELRRHLDSCKEEVRYLAARLAEMTAQRDALHAQLRFASVHLSARGAEAAHAAD